MIFRTLRPALLLVAPLTFTLACSEDAAPPNRVTIEASSTATRSTAVGSTATVHFKHEFVKPPASDCDGGCGGNACEDEILPIDSRVVEATCEAATCTAKAVRTAPGEFDVRVQSTVAGVVGVRIVLATPDGATFEARSEAAFATPTGLVISSPWTSSPWTGVYASLPGAVRTACVDVVGVDGVPLNADAGTLALDAGGLETSPAYVPATSWSDPPARCDRIVASEGPGSFHATYALGALAATLPVEVVAPETVTRVSVVDVGSLQGLGSAYAAAKTDLFAAAPDLDRLDVTCSYGPPLLVRFVTGAGVVGIADASKALSFGPEALADASTSSDWPDSPIASVAPRATGDGVLRAQVGPAGAEIPLHIVGCGVYIGDGGTTDSGATEAAGDAGADGSVDGG